MPAPIEFLPHNVTGAAAAGNRSSYIDPRLSRSSYYDGRLLRAEDLIRDQQYLDQRLREIGRARGPGVVRGLTVRLSGHLLHIQPGIGVTGAGRVLELDPGRNLQVDLGNRAVLQAINRSPSGRLGSGLYAVCLSLAERAQGIAEVFPTDLSEQRRPRPDRILEGLRLDLVPLDLPLSRASQVLARAQLAPHLAGVRPQRIDEDSLPLAVLAVWDDRPQWCDDQLLRHAPREPGLRNERSEDLALHYNALFQDIRADRVAHGLPADAWRARDYCRLLPPIGPAPRESFNPMQAWQQFFPEDWTVHLAPVRSDDWEAVRRQALALEALDLEREREAQVMVLVRLSPEVFGRHAPDLERSPEYPVIDPLRLRFLRRSPVQNPLDQASDVWAKIWDQVGIDDVFYVRRAPLAATNQVATVVAASGYAALPQDPPGDTVVNDSIPVITSGSEHWFSAVDYSLLWQLRKVSPDGGEEKRICEAVIGQDKLQRALLSIFLMTERRFDAVLWKTLSGILFEGVGGGTHVLLSMAETFGDLPTNANIRSYLKVLEQAGLPKDIIALWEASV